MKFTIFGLSITSAWGNGHATLLRGLLRALAQDGHTIDFFECDTPYYASHRDAPSLPFVNIHLYDSWENCLPAAQASLGEADVAIVTSYCPHGAAASDLISTTPHLFSIFYDMDTPVTLSELSRGKTPAYLPSSGLGSFDLVLSYTGGEALQRLQSHLGAQRVEPLYGWVDPDSYVRTDIRPEYSCDLSYLGTYSADRQAALEAFLIEPARRLSQKQFVIAGAMYPDRTTWPSNIRTFEHIAPPEHASFYSSGAITLNITRGAMASMGYCPSGRLFEAAACGTPLMSDWWLGLDSFFSPGEEILIAENTDQAIAILGIDHRELTQIAVRARQRTLDCHTAHQRAQRLLKLIEEEPAPAADDERVYQGVR